MTTCFQLGLTQGTALEFELFEDGQPQALDTVSSEATPATFAILVDASQSMSRQIGFVQSAAGKLPRHLRDIDTVVLAPFRNGIINVTGPTRDAATITDAATFRTIVKEGGLKMNGMPPFSNIPDKDLEDIRFYLRARAQQAPAEEKALLEKAKAAKQSNAKPQDFAGKWNIVIQTPVGPQKAIMNLKVNGNILTGVVEAAQGNVEVSGAVANGRAKMSGKASMPMPITVSYELLPAPAIALSPGTLSFSAVQGNGNPPAQTVQVTNGGQGTLGNLAVGTVTYAAGQPTGWLGTHSRPSEESSRRWTPPPQSCRCPMSYVAGQCPSWSRPTRAEPG